MGDERRGGERHELWVPLQIESDDGWTFGVTQNTSARGLLVATAGAFEVGVRVTLTLSLPRARGTVEMEGVIVRVGPNPNDPEGPLGAHIAVELHEAHPELDQIRAALAQAAPEVDPPE